MKKTIAILLAVLMMVSVCSDMGTTASAEEQTRGLKSEGFTYDIREDGTAVITYYEGEETDLVIPTELDGHPVTAIGKQAFYYNNYLTSLVIPEGVSSIGDYAIGSNYNVAFTSITIPDSLTEFGANPFHGCKNGTEFIISDQHPALELIDGVLFTKADKKLILYPHTLNAEEYEIPKGTKIIGEGAFQDCRSLTSVVLPKGLTTIEKRAFYYTIHLASVKMPKTVTTIGDEAFAYCDFASIVIPNNVTSIGRGAFLSCMELESVDIPNSVTEIGDSAFSGCITLSSVTIPDSVSTLGANPFQGCKSLKEIRLSEKHPTLELVEGVLFSKPDKRLVFYPRTFEAEEYAIPDGTEIIDTAAFSYCKSLRSIHIPDSVTSIGREAFSYCYIRSVSLPDGVTVIGDRAFEGCEILESVNIPESVTSIGFFAFKSCPKLSVTVERDSYAEQYCIDNGIEYSYP